MKREFFSPIILCPARDCIFSNQDNAPWIPCRTPLRFENDTDDIRQPFPSISEHMEESPRLLARPSTPKSWDVSRREGVSSRRGIGGEGGHPRTAQKALKSLAA
jgi:hypothetical protein